MTYAINKGYGLMDDFIVSLEALIEGLNAAKDEAAPKLEEALERWVANVERDAKTKLNRPRWLLQQNISSKVKAYRQNHKVWAMVRFWIRLRLRFWFERKSFYRLLRHERRLLLFRRERKSGCRSNVGRRLLYRLEWEIFF